MNESEIYNQLLHEAEAYCHKSHPEFSRASIFAFALSAAAIRIWKLEDALAKEQAKVKELQPLENFELQ